MKVDLDDFIAATVRLHSASVKRTRLMLKLRPHARAEHRRRIFVLKATDGKTVYTTHVGSLAELKKVDALVNEFVSTCTRDALPPLSTPAPPSQQQQQQPSASLANANQQTAGPSSDSHHQNHSSSGGGKQQSAGKQQGGGQNNQSTHSNNKSGKGGKKGRK